MKALQPAGSRNNLKGMMAAFSSAALLGLTPIFGKQAILSGISPFAVVAVRTTIAALLLFVIILLFQRKYLYIYSLGLIGCLVAGFVNGIGSIFYYTALARLDATIGQLLYSAYPLFVALWLLLDRQPIRKLTIIRLLFAGPGVYLLLSSSLTQIDLVGALLMIGAALLYALHLIINQRILYEAPAQTVTLYTLISMSITVSVAYLLFDRQLPAAGVSWSPVVILGVITFLARVALFMGVKKIGGLQTSLVGLGELLVTVVAARLWLGDQLSSLQWVGLVLLCMNLILVGFERPTPHKRHTSGMLSWLNPPRIAPSDLSWPSKT